MNTKTLRGSALVGPAGLLMLAPLVTGAAESPSVLHIDFTNLRTAKGVVHLDVCTKAQFLKECPISADTPSKIGGVRLTVKGLPAGTYAIQAFLDENGNKKVDRGLFGMPKEGVGFSNDAKITFGPPSWKDAAFTTNGAEQTIHIKMRYFLGGENPR
ncbi:DUF2141 domain-containing protein [Sphingomonas immobilis]|uniref:DUF2141 domain-containing protein n=1 Tax=Sphingomonas immobilis TaxID=3063997 RepID=UPI0027296E0E|nr:DUF2141 domain-containing protein [Sphingomonas sp. CA1-15]